jgi:uncharacterized protein YkwD
MNYIDILLIIGLVAFGLLAYYRGFIREAVDLLILSASLGVALLLFDNLSVVLLGYISLPETFVKAGAFFFIWFVVELFLYITASFILARVPENIIDSHWNRWAGAVLGAAKSLVILSLIVLTLLLLPLGNDIKGAFRGSFFANYIEKNSVGFEKMLEKTFGDTISALSRFSTVTSGSKETVELGYKVSNPSVDKVSASSMLESVNSERRKAGQKDLSLDAKLSEVAAGHAKDMFAQGYISHYSRNGESAFDRMGAAGISTFFAGENLALATTEVAAMAGLMNSAGHRANILSGDFAKIGIFVYDGGPRGKIFVQEFTD